MFQTTIETTFVGDNVQTQVNIVRNGNGTQHLSSDVVQQRTVTGQVSPAYRFPTFEQDDGRRGRRAGMYKKIFAKVA